MQLLCFNTTDLLTLNRLSHICGKHQVVLLPHDCKSTKALINFGAISCRDNLFDSYFPLHSSLHSLSSL